MKLRKVIFGVLTCLALILFQAIQGWGLSAAEELYEKAKMEPFMFKKLAIYNEAIAMDKNLINARKERAFILYYQGRYLEAIDDLTACIENGLDGSEVRSLRAKAFIALKEYQKARDDLSIAIAFDDQNREARLDRALANARLKEYNEAINDLKVLLREDHHDKTSKLAYRLMGEILLARGENDIAREYFAKAGRWDSVLGISFPGGMYNAKLLSVMGMIGLVVSCAALIFKVDLPAPRRSKKR
jgi:tetratricopeptide (TPR) repeat protein